MKLRIVLVVSFLLALLFACNKTVVIEYPDYDTNGGDGDISFSINRIELTDDATIFDMSFYHFPGYWVRVDSDTKLIGVNTGKVYSMFKMEGMRPDTTEWMQKEAFRNATFYFEPIDPQDKEVDFIESDEWTVKGIKLYDNTKGKIKTNLSGTLDYFGGSWLRIIETGDNFKYGKTYIVPVRDGKFNYDIYTVYPRLFNVMIGKEYRSGSMAVANFWSEGDSVRLDYPKGDIKNFTITGGQLTMEQNEFDKIKEEETDKIYKGYYTKIKELESIGLLKTKRFMDLEYRFENEAIGRERENILDTLIQLNNYNHKYTAEGEKLVKEIDQYYESNRDSINKEVNKFYIEILKKPSMVNLGTIYREIRDGDIGNKRELLNLFQENYKDFHPEHPYHKYLTEISRIYDRE